jgi:hypothetical protein
MQVAYQLTPADFRAGFKAHQNRSAWSRWGFRLLIAFLAVVCLVSFAVSVLAQEPNTRRNAAAIFVVMIFGIVLQFVAPRFAAKRQFQGNPAAQLPTTLTTSDEGLHFASSHSSGNASWKMYVRFEETKDNFVLFSSPVVFHPIPKRAFTPEQLTEFRTLLQRHIGSR